jgi:hypothetical protein
MIRLKFFFFLLFLPCSALAQPRPFSDADMVFFQKKAIQYQRWLDTLGISPTLRVEEVRFQKNRKTGKIDRSELELFLTLSAPDPDTAAAEWNSLSKGYEKTAGRSLKDALFRTFIHNMEIPAAQGNVQIYARKSSGKRSPCFFVWVWEDKGVLKDSLLRNGCKAQTFNVSVPPIEVKKAGSKGKSAAIKKSMKPDEAFDKVMAFVREKYPYNKYERTDCSGRHPAVEDEERKDGVLRFTLTELCREALTNGNLGAWCKIARATGWQKDCNDIRRERLEFTITYTPNDRTGGFTLDCHLRGKFGASDYVPRSGDYFDMDPDFLKFEEEYARIFKRDLSEYCKKKP